MCVQMVLSLHLLLFTFSGRFAVRIAQLTGSFLISSCDCQSLLHYFTHIVSWQKNVTSAADEGINVALPNHAQLVSIVFFAKILNCHIWVHICSIVCILKWWCSSWQFRWWSDDCQRITAVACAWLEERFSGRIDHWVQMLALPYFIQFIWWFINFS